MRFRVHGRLVPVVLWICIIVLAGLGGIVVWGVLGPASQARTDRITILLASDPLTIVSVHRTKPSMYIIVMPADIVMSAVRGYGSYTGSALWKLGYIDHRGGSLLQESIEDAFGIVIDGYMGTSQTELASVKPEDHVRQLFSYANIPGHMIGRYSTNLSLGDYWRAIRRVRSVGSESVVVYVDSQAATSETLPDGTSTQRLDSSKVDLLLPGVFEDEIVRKEALRISVYNTTSVPGVGQRIARTLGNVGMIVVSVANKDTLQPTCTLHTREEHRKSRTIELIQSMFACTVEPLGDDETADIAVFLGTANAEKYITQAE